MSAPAVRRIAVYGEIDPNLVDGSSVWLQSVCRVLGSIDGVAVTLLLRRPLLPERRFLLDALAAHPAIELLDAGRPELLRPAEALAELQRLERERGRFDLVLLRGQAVLAEVAQRGAFEGRLWSYAMPGRGMSEETLRSLAAGSARLLCQTEAAAEELRRVVPEANGSLLTLPPMIPDLGPPPSRGGAARPLRLAYSGKLAPEYCWLEIVDAFAVLRTRQPAAELHVLGDKIHRPPEQPDFHERATRALRETEGLHWHGAVPREAVHGLLAECDLALSVRDPGVEAARELSTKVLEYGAAGLPVVLNRAPAYERLLGEDYPLFVAGPGDAVRALTGPALDPAVRAAAAAACREASRDFTFGRVAERLAVHLPGPPAARVLIAGHDLKFTAPIREAIAAVGAEVVEDVWQSHTEHDEPASRAALAEADVILCEWCLGNAAWYSRNKRPDQRLVVRMHRMEVETDHPVGVDIDAIDAMVFVSEHVRDDAAARFGWDGGCLRVIPNAIDCERLRRPKAAEARFELALIGYVPRLKRLDRVLDLLERLRRDEPRFRLTVVGRPPSDFAWVVGRDDEVEAYRRVFGRIEDADLLRGAVEFLPFTTDLPSLFERVGWIVSASDVEGHQVTLAEGAASGAVPVIFNRPGARTQYPSRWIHDSAEAAAAAVLGLGADAWLAEGIVAADHAAAWSHETLRPRWAEVLGLGAARRGPAAEPGSAALGEPDRALAEANPER